MDRSPEARLFRTHWQDGALDLVAGGSLLLIGLGYVIDQLMIPLVVPLAFAAWFILRKQVVEPRAGYVEFSRERRQHTARALSGAVAFGLGALALVSVAVVLSRGEGRSALQAVDAVPALLVALAALVGAALTRSVRFGVYAVLIAGAGALTVLLGTGPAIPLLAGGAVVCGTGAVLLARFLAESRPFIGQE